MSPFWMFVVAGLLSQPPLRLVVNIPAYRLDAYVGDSIVRTIRIAPGMPGFRTPRGEFAVTSIEWNPRWNPPARPWASKERPMPPGPTNPMGRVKLNFQPLYFLHGTPLVQSIGTAASHGCVRMRNADAIGLARLVHRYGTPTLSTDDVERLATDSVTTREIPVTVPVPFEIRYDLVEVRNGRVAVYRDVYGLASRPLRAELYATLAAHRVDTLRIDPARAAALIRHVGATGNSIALDSLISATAGVH